MRFFSNLFKSRKQKDFELMNEILETSQEIVTILKKRKERLEKGFPNFDFIDDMKDKTLILNYYEHKVLNFMDEEYKTRLVKIFLLDESDDDYKRFLSSTYHYLSSLNSSLEQSIRDFEKEL